jgi:pectate lyase
MPMAVRGGERTEADEVRLRSVVIFADNVLARGRDQWSGRDTPLFADGIDPRTGEPAVWRFKGREYVISNLASQQNLLRTLDALTAATGDVRYRDAAEATVRYHFEHLVSDCGLLHWGGHRFIDLKTLESFGGMDVGQHELKNHHPYYELMWRLNEAKTARLLRAIWNAHILDWGRLDMNRHGSYGRDLGPLWRHGFEDPEPFFDGQGLTFVNCGTDCTPSR